jgi:SAM-dependent methyltransferase
MSSGPDSNWEKALKSIIIHSMTEKTDSGNFMDGWVINAEETGNRDYRESHGKLVSYIRNAIQGPILDCGCGNGIMMRLLEEAGVAQSDLFGLDLIQSHVDLSVKNTGNVNIKVADLSVPNSIPFKKEFALVLALGWLHNCPEEGALSHYLGAIIDNFSSVLAPEGMLIYDLPRTPNSEPTFEESTTYLKQECQAKGMQSLFESPSLYIWERAERSEVKKS